MAAAGLALVLASCDLPGGSEQSGDEAEIREVLTETLTTNDPVQCTTVVTQRFLEQNLDERGRKAVEDCRFEANTSKSVFADELDFGELRVEGAKAHVTFDASGGASDGSTVTIELVRDEGQWKLDRFTEVEIDRARFDRALYETSLQEGTTRREARCLVAETRRRSTTGELEREFVETDFRDIPDPFVLCLGEETLTRFVEEGFRAGFAAADKSGIPPPVVDCILNRFTERLSVAQLRVLLSAGDAAERYLTGLSGSAGRACIREYKAGVLGDQPRT